MVFFPAEEVNQCADQIRQAAGRGHKVGLIPTGNTPAQRLESVEAGSRQLAGILRQETWFVLSKESTLAEAGYLCWTPSLTFSSVTDPTRTYETLVRAGEQQGSALRVLVHSQSAGGALAGVLGQLAQEQERTAGELREIQEAIQAGLAAQRALEEMSGDLSGAENWGVWDMVGGGIMATFAKHGCLDDAQDAAYEARRALSRFRTELADVSSEQVPDVELGDFAVFADYFFDGLFADLFVQSRIREAQEQVEAVTQRVERLIVRLRDERENLEEKQGQLDWERERLLTAQNRAQLQSGAETGEAVPV